MFLWDLDDTLVPWDSMSKGKLEGGKEFFAEWFQLSKDLQQAFLFNDELKALQQHVALPASVGSAPILLSFPPWS